MASLTVHTTSGEQSTVVFALIATELASGSSGCVWGGWKYPGPNLKRQYKFYMQLPSEKSICFFFLQF